MGDQAYENIHVVASILKMYLRLLPIPLITFDVHPHVLEALGNNLLCFFNVTFVNIDYVHTTKYKILLKL